MKIKHILFSVPISSTSKSQALALVGEWVREYRSVIGPRSSVLGSKSIGFQLAGPKPINRKQTNQKQKTLPDFAWTKSRRAGENRKPITGFPKIVVTPNPEMIVAAQTDPEFLKALQSADLAIPDGVGIIWALKHLSLRGLRRGGGRGNLNKRFPRDVPSGTSLGMTDMQISNLSRISGLDLMESLIREPQKVGPFELKVMLLGGRPGIAEKVKRHCEARQRRAVAIPSGSFAPLRMTAVSGPQNIENISKSENDRLITSINHVRPDLLFVAFGHGKQEKWLTKNRHRLNAGVAMGVGGALDQIADPSLRPPVYINSIGLGWLYRLLREPRRWKRQLALVKFIWMVIKAF